MVHTRNLAALEAVVPAWAVGVPVRIHGEHGRDARDPNGTRRRYQWVRRAYRPFVSRYVAVSQDLERYLRTRVGVPEDRIVQLYNGVDSDRFHPVQGARIAIDGCPFRSPEHWLVGTVGRMDPVKDQCTLARSFVLALQMNPSAQDRMRLVIVGDGALRAECESILEEGGARHLAWFAGDRNDIPEIMRGLDCFVLPSLGEGISNTILEAMSCAHSGRGHPRRRQFGTGERRRHWPPRAARRSGRADAGDDRATSIIERWHASMAPPAAGGSRKALVFNAWWTLTMTCILPSFA